LEGDRLEYGGRNLMNKDLTTTWEVIVSTTSTTRPTAKHSSNECWILQQKVEGES
jgi:hypothetical protein